MTQRVDFFSVPPAYQALRQVHDYVQSTSLDKRLIHLIDIRASQINGCAFCIDMHTKQARAAGESEQRLYTLSAWRETQFFTPQERAVLALTEQVTRIADGGVSDAVYRELEPFFTPEQIVHLIMAVISINSWNRIVLATGKQPAADPPSG